MGDRLYKARKVTGLDAQQFADEVGIHRSSVRRYEEGAATPRPVVLKAWALKSGVSYEWLLTGVVTSNTGDTNQYHQGLAPVHELHPRGRR